MRTLLFPLPQILLSVSVTDVTERAIKFIEIYIYSPVIIFFFFQFLYKLTADDIEFQSTTCTSPIDSDQSRLFTNVE